MPIPGTITGATGARGEATIVAGDEQVRVLFTNRAIAEAEKAIGRSILGILQGFVENTTGIGDLAQLLLQGMQAARRDARGGSVVRIQDAWDVLDAAGFGTVAAAVMEAVAAVLAYDPNAEAEDEDPNA